MRFDEHYLTESTTPNEKVYQMVQKLHRNYDDFIDGDLGDRLDNYDNYELKDINISDLDLEEWDVQEDLVDNIVDEMKKNKEYPPIVVGDDMSIIDGIHRANALNKLGFNKIRAYVGVSEWDLMNTIL